MAKQGRGRATRQTKPARQDEKTTPDPEVHAAKLAKKREEVAKKADQTTADIDGVIDAYREEVGEEFAKNYVQQGGE